MSRFLPHGAGAAMVRGAALIAFLADTQVVAQSPGVVIARNTEVVSRGECVTAQISASTVTQCGDLRVIHPLPTVQTLGKTWAPALIYNSSTARVIPVVLADVTVPSGTLPDTVEVRAIFAGDQLGISKYPGSAWGSGGNTRRVAVKLDVTGYGTAIRYLRVDATLVGGPNTTYSSATTTMTTIDRSASPYGAGWWVAGLEELRLEWDGCPYWIGGDGSTRHYCWNGSSYQTVWPFGPRDSITVDGSDFVRWISGGGKVRFNSAGLHISTTDPAGYVTAFTYVSGTSRLSTLSIPVRTGSPLTYSFSYDSSNLLQSITAPGSRVVSTIRNGGRITGIYDPDERLTEFAYGSSANANRMVVAKDKRGAVAFFAFDSASRLVKSVRPLGTSFGAFLKGNYGAAGSLDEEVVDAVFGTYTGEVTFGAYIAANYGLAQSLNASTVNDIFGAYTATSDAVVQAFRPAETVGLSTAVQLDSAYTRIDGPRPDSDVSDVTKIWLNPYGAPTKVHDAVGGQTLLTYDSTWPGLVKEAEAPSGFIRKVVFGTAGRDSLAIGVNPLGTSANDTTRYEWDPKWSKVTKVTTHLGVVTQFAYDTGNGNMLWSQPGTSSNRRTTYQYDATSKLLVSATQPLTRPDSITYDSLGNVKGYRTAARYWTEYRRDGYGRDTLVLTAIAVADSAFAGTDSLRRRTRTKFNSSGLVDSTQTLGASQSLVVRHYYDADGRDTLITRRDPGISDIAALATRFRYDAAGRVVAEVAADGFKDSTVYDPAGNATKRINRNGDTLVMVYDALNRLVRQTTASITLPSESFGDTSWHFPLYSTTLPVDTVSFAYDSTGLITANNGDARVARTYYRNGLLKTETQRIRTYTGTDFDQHVYALQWGYDLDGRRTKLVRPWGDTLVYAYESATGGLESIAQSGTTAAFTFSNDYAGRVHQLTSTGGVTETFTYDSTARLRKRQETGTNYWGWSATGYSTSLHADSLTYDPQGRVSIARTQLDSVITEYSPLGAVKNMTTRSYAAEVLRDETFTNDAFANRRSSSTQASFAYDSATGRLVKFTQYGISDTTLYDHAGNVRIRGWAEWVGGEPFFSGSRSYYGADNKLRVLDRRLVNVPSYYGVPRPDQRGAFEEYRYDALGRRVLMRSRRSACEGPCKSAIERYIWDGSDLIGEIRYPGRHGIDADSLEVDEGVVSLMLIEQIYENEPPDTTITYNPNFGVTYYTYGGQIDRPLFVQRAFYGQDSILFGTVQLLPHYDWRGLMDEATDLDGIGAQSTGLKMDWPGRDVGVFGDRSFNGTPRSWIGGVLDQMRDASGLQYKRNRYYDPASGRFTQEDPIGLAGGMNLYGYAGGDPVTYSDPSGLCPPCQVSEQGVAFIAGFEGFRSKQYLDAAGNATIGFGHRIMRGEKFDKLTREQGLDLLRRDIAERVQGGLDAIQPDLGQNEVDAMASFIFNVGESAFKGSTLLRGLNAGNKSSVPGELLRWNKAGGMVLDGLTRRRTAEGTLWSSGQYKP